MANADERVELFKVFSRDPSRIETISKVLNLALTSQAETDFHLVSRVAQFAEFYGQLIANCWYSPKNCQHDAIRTFSQCQTDVSWILDLLKVESNPFVVQSAVHALNAIFKAISADNSDHSRNRF